MNKDLQRVLLFQFPEATNILFIEDQNNLVHYALTSHPSVHMHLGIFVAVFIKQQLK